jgi:arylsulfatase
VFDGTAFLETFKEFPPRHEPAGFTIDHAVKALQKFLAKD